MICCDRLPEACSPLLVVLAGVQDPGNVGTIIANCFARLAQQARRRRRPGQSGTASPFSPKALRASAGAALHLPVLAGMSLPILLTQLRVAGVRTLASVSHATTIRQHASSARARTRISKRSSAISRPRPLAPWDVDWCEPVACWSAMKAPDYPKKSSAAPMPVFASRWPAESNR